MSATLPGASDPDGDAISYALAIEPRHGVVTVQPDGHFSYTPASGFSGADQFGFSVSDGLGGINLYTSHLEVPPGTRTLVQGGSGAEALSGGAVAEAFYGGAGNDRITGAGGDDVIDGGEGVDTAVFLSPRAIYTVARTSYGWTVQAGQTAEGLDRLTNVERLQFTHTAIAFDLDGHAGAVAQILRALFGKDFLANNAFVGLGLQLFDAGTPYAEVVRLAVGTDVFAQLAGGRSSTAFVNHVYKNVMGQLPSAGELSYFAGVLDRGELSQDALALLACQTVFNTESVDLVGLASTGIEFTPGGG